MSVVLAKSAGFCSGVHRAVQTAYQLLENPAYQDKKIYMFGELIHNALVTGDLKQRGVILLENPQQAEAGSVVIIRAHGISPQVRAQFDAIDCELVDCTCGYVNHIHQIVHKAFSAGHKILLVGDPNHPEVQGINGACEHSAVVISSLEEAKNLDLSHDLWTIVAQTTFSFAVFDEILAYLKNKFDHLHYFDTICNATDRRQREAGQLAAQSDVMLVIGSQHSSNTVKLLDTCRSICEQTYLIECMDDLTRLITTRSWAGFRIGITAGASTPKSMIMEVFHRMTENETNMGQAFESDANDVSFTDFIDNIPQLHRGATVEGVVVRYDADYVYVDVKDKTEGRIPRREFTEEDFNLDEAIENRTPIDVYVKSIRQTDMGKEINLSKSRVDFIKNRSLVEEAFKNKTPINVKVVNVVKDGLIATYGGVDVYIHRTQIELNIVDDLEPYKGQNFDILITQFDAEKRRLRVSGSRRVLLSQERKERADEVWGSIEVGDIYDGVVRNLTDFGAFVDIGGVDGLVHISELSWNRIKHPSEVVAVGDSIQVYVKDFDKEKKRISLGYKRIEDDPYHNIEERFPVGSTVKGKVVRLFAFGAFIEIEEGVDALCHISQISNRRLTKPNDVLEEGMEVEARVIEVSNESRRVSVSIKDVNPIDTPLNGVVFEDAPEDAAEEEPLPTSYSDDAADNVQPVISDEDAKKIQEAFNETEEA